MESATEPQGLPAVHELARRLYERFGFTAVGVRKRYYQPSGVDAIVMMKEGQ